MPFPWLSKEHLRKKIQENAHDGENFTSESLPFWDAAHSLTADIVIYSEKYTTSLEQRADKWTLLHGILLEYSQLSASYLSTNDGDWGYCH